MLVSHTRMHAGTHPPTHPHTYVYGFLSRVSHACCGTTFPSPILLPKQPISLSKLLQLGGIGSRKACQKLVEEGCVHVDGVETRTPNLKVPLREDREASRSTHALLTVSPVPSVVVRSHALQKIPVAPTRLFMLHKPVDVLCDDVPLLAEPHPLSKDTPPPPLTLWQFLEQQHGEELLQRGLIVNPETTAQALRVGGSLLFSVGRLDLKSEGLLLITNNGKLAQAMELPRFQLPRVYEVGVLCGTHI